MKNCTKELLSETLVKDTECLDIEDYLEEIGQKGIEISYDEFQKLNPDLRTFKLTEIGEIVKEQIPVVLVKFPEVYSLKGYTYIFCEVPGKKSTASDNEKEKTLMKLWKDMEKKYPQDRESMTEEMERRFVEDCFSCYEEEGFSPVFWSPFGDHKERFGECFEVVGRCSAPDEADLCALPMWNIKFQDGTIIGAYPEEIIPSQMRENGCDLKEIESPEEKEEKKF